MEKFLYRFYWDCGRMGDLEGLFIADPDRVKAMLGLRVYFGEVLGKHSEIYGTLTEDDLTVISKDQDKIEWLANLLGTTVSGWNPIRYINVECEVCGDPVAEYGDWYEHELIDGSYIHKECVAEYREKYC